MCVLSKWTLTWSSPDQPRGSSPQKLPLGTHPSKSAGQPVATEGRCVMEPHFACTLSDSLFPERKCIWWTQPQGSWGPPVSLTPLCSQASWRQEGAASPQGTQAEQRRNEKMWVIAGKACIFSPTCAELPQVAPPFSCPPPKRGPEGPSLYNFSPSRPASQIGCSVSPFLPQRKLLSHSFSPPQQLTYKSESDGDFLT